MELLRLIGNGFYFGTKILMLFIKLKINIQVKRIKFNFHLWLSHNVIPKDTAKTNYELLRMKHDSRMAIIEYAVAKKMFKESFKRV